MAAVDSLIGLIELRKADGLVLEAGRVPSLLGGPGGGALTMPPLDASLMAIFLEDLLTPDQNQSVREGQIVESEYRSASQGSFVIKTRIESGRAKMTIRKGVLRQSAVAAPKFAPDSSHAPRSEVGQPISSAPFHTNTVALPHEPTPPHSSAGAITSSTAAEAISPVLRELLTQAQAHNASDIFLSAGRPSTMKVLGELVPLSGPLLSHDELSRLFELWLNPRRQEQLNLSGNIDFGLQLQPDGTRFRINLFRQLHGLAAAIRPIREKMPELSQLALPRALLRVVAAPQGLVLLTGPTGSGKSTTVAALLEHVNRTRSCHVITLEDPIEFEFSSGRSVFHQREIGTHVADFATGLRAALRESPDIILVGEMRDPETIALALTAAETGHLVLSTLHAGSSVGAIERIVNAFADAQRAGVRAQVAASLRYVVTQHLLPATDGTHIPVVEQIAVNHAVASQIRDGRMHLLTTQMELGSDDGMVTLEASLLDLVRKGRINPKVALAVAPNKETFEAQLAAQAKLGMR